MKFSGVTMRKVFSDLGRESLFKRLESSAKNETPPSEKTQAALVNTINALRYKGQQTKKVNALINAMKDPAAVTAEIGKMGFWESYLLSRDKLEAHQEYIIEVERSCLNISKEISQGKFQKSLQLLKKQSLMKLFLCPSVETAYKRVKTIQQFGPVQLAIALEVQLSVLASVDVNLMPNKSTTNSIFMQLLPNDEGSPSANFFRWLKQLLNAKTIDEWLNHEQIISCFGCNELDVSTVKRWSNGSFHPSHAVINRLILAIQGENSDKLLALDWAARFINALGYLAQTCVDRAEEFALSDPKVADNKWKPWPLLPFGFSSFDEWIINRYPIWLEFHIKR